MSPVVFSDILQTLRAQIEAFLTSEVADLLAQARTDSEAFLAASRADLERWTVELAVGQMTPDEFASLVRGQVAICKLAALEQAGLAAIRLDRIRSSILQIILDTVIRI
jgi:hypothetical protein